MERKRNKPYSKILVYFLFILHKFSRLKSKTLPKIVLMYTLVAITAYDQSFDV